MVFDETNYDDMVKSGVVLVKFGANWCQPCNLMTPILGRLEKEYDGKVVFGSVNVDENPELSNRFGISSIPSLFFYKNGEIVNQILGVQSENSLKSSLNELLK